MSSVDPVGGGPIEGVLRLGAALRRDGHEVEILSCDDPHSACVPECQLPVHALGPARHRYSYTARLVPWLRANAATYDLVIVNGLWQYNGLAVWRVLRNGPTPYVVFVHGMLDPWFKRAYPLKHVKKWMYWPWAQYRVIRDACVTIFTCEEERVMARRSFWLYKCNEAVVRYGTADPGDRDSGEREKFLSSFPMLRDTRSFLYLGRIHEKKGCDLLIQGFASVACRDGALRLVMAGPDVTNWKPRLTQLAKSLGIAEQVVWPGSLSGEMKWGAFRSAEAFVLFSHQENFGIAVAEALACGLPVLISDKVNIWREIQADAAGLVDTDTASGAEALFRRWLSMTEEAREGMRRHARQCFIARFDIRGTVESLMQILTAHGVPL